MCNLYPFEATIARPGASLADAVEEIDIGGVTLLRAAAKNHARVSVLSDPADYAKFVAAWPNVGEGLRARLALKAFEMTATYDAAISGYFREQYATAGPEAPLSGLVQRLPLRYGVNPHQKPAQAFVEHGTLPFKGIYGHRGVSSVLMRRQCCPARRATSTCSMPSTRMLWCSSWTRH